MEDCFLAADATHHDDATCLAVTLILQRSLLVSNEYVDGYMKGVSSSTEGLGATKPSVAVEERNEDAGESATSVR